MRTTEKKGEWQPDRSMLEIHENCLEKDCQEQPQFVFLCGCEVAKASRAVKLSKNKLKLVEAELKNEVRCSPEKFGIDKSKPTVDEVAAAVIEHVRYQEAASDVIDAEYREDVLNAFMKSLSDRKQEIENMVHLHGQMYWSKPNVGKDMDGEVQKEKAKETQIDPRRRTNRG